LKLLRLYLAQAKVPTIVLIWGLLVFFVSYGFPLTIYHDVGSEKTFIKGLHLAEKNSFFSYAYTKGNAFVAFPQIGTGEFIVSLRLGGPKEAISLPTQLLLGPTQVDLGRIASPRCFHLLIPTDEKGDLQFNIASKTIKFDTDSDQRRIGIFIDWLIIHSLTKTTPSLSFILVFASILALSWGAILLFKLPQRQKIAAFLLFSSFILFAGIMARGKVAINSWMFVIYSILSVIVIFSRKSIVAFFDNPIQEIDKRHHKALILALQIGLTSAVILLFGWHTWFQRAYLIDDTFISLVYAKNLIQGNGITFNGEHVAGYSNFLWVILIALLGFCGIDLLIAAKVLGVICAFSIMIVLIFTSRHFFADKLRLTGLLASLLLSASSPYIAWAVAGLETLGFTFLVLSSIFLIVWEEQQKKLSWSGLALFGLTLMRPEGIGLVVALTGMRFVARLFLNRETICSRNFILGISTPFLGYLAFISWHWHYYGYFLPTTVYAKTGDLATQVQFGLFYLSNFSNESSNFHLFLVLGLPLLFLIKQRRLLNSLALGTILAYSLFIILAGGDWMPAYRFIVPLLPLIYLLAAQEIMLLSLFCLRLSRFLGSLVFFFLTSLALFNVWQASSSHFAEIHKVAQDTQGTIQIGQFMARLAQPGESIALVDAGAIPYFTGARIIDMIGLNDNHIAHLPGKFMAKYDNAYVLAQRPTYVQMHVVFKNGVIYPTDFIGTEKLYYLPEFQRLYAPLAESPYIFRLRTAPFPTEK